MYDYYVKIIGYILYSFVFFKPYNDDQRCSLCSLVLWLLPSAWTYTSSVTKPCKRPPLRAPDVSSLQGVTSYRWADCKWQHWISMVTLYTYCACFVRISTKSQYKALDTWRTVLYEDHITISLKIANLNWKKEFHTKPGPQDVFEFCIPKLWFKVPFTFSTTRIVQWNTVARRVVSQALGTTAYHHLRIWWAPPHHPAILPWHKCKTLGTAWISTWTNMTSTLTSWYQLEALKFSVASNLAQTLRPLSYFYCSKQPSSISLPNSLVNPGQRILSLSADFVTWLSWNIQTSIFKSLHCLVGWRPWRRECIVSKKLVTITTWNRVLTPAFLWAELTLLFSASVGYCSKFIVASDLCTTQYINIFDPSLMFLCCGVILLHQKKRSGPPISDKSTKASGLGNIVTPWM